MQRRQPNPNQNYLLACKGTLHTKGKKNEKGKRMNEFLDPESLHIHTLRELPQLKQPNSNRAC